MSIWVSLVQVDEGLLALIKDKNDVLENLIYESELDSQYSQFQYNTDTDDFGSNLSVLDPFSDMDDYAEYLDEEELEDLMDVSSTDTPLHKAIYGSEISESCEIGYGMVGYNSAAKVKELTKEISDDDEDLYAFYKLASKRGYAVICAVT